MTTKPAFQSEAVKKRYGEFPDTVRDRLFELRRLIFDVASKTDGVGQVEEALKWNQPAFLTTKPKSGTTIRICEHDKDGKYCALYVHCQTDLVDRYRELYSNVLRFEGNRAIVFENDKPIPFEPLSHCVQMALTYHVR